eukprot:evm.model.scf_281.14 EVM.evm.TU.scf_281.14   scf_281:100887-107408(+)
MSLWPLRKVHGHHEESIQKRAEADKEFLIVRDLYGFELTLTAEQQEERLQCEKKATERAAKHWRKYQERRRLPSDKKKLKAMVRKGVPPGMRAWVWTELSGAAERQHKLDQEYYRLMVERGHRATAVAKQIELDLPRTFPGHAWFQTEQGQAILQNVLLAYSVHNPQIGYCQSMNYIVAMLLLCMDKDEEKAFWVLAALIEDILYAGTYERHLSGCHVEMKSLQELVGTKLPRLAKHLEELHCEMSIIATDWYLCLFSTSLPSEVAARVWDALFSEGPKVLFRIAVAILQINQKELMEIDNAGELLGAVKNAAKRMHARDNLLKVAFEGIGTLSMTTIDKIREIKQQDVDSMLSERERKLDTGESRRRKAEEIRNRWLPSEKDTAHESSNAYASSGGTGGIEMTDMGANGSVRNAG